MAKRTRKSEESDKEEMPVTPDAQTVGKWLDEIEVTRQKLHDWYAKGAKVIERYKDQRPATAVPAYVSHRMNVLWSNVETLMPAMYARTPQPSVQRRNKDKDPAGRWASIVLERALSFTLGTHDFDLQMRESCKDYLLPGRGQIWIRYEPTFEKDPESGEDVVSWETTKAEYLHWRDFLTNQARSWNEVYWVARRGYYTRAEGRKRFGDIFDKVELDHRPEDKNDGQKPYGTQNFRKGTVWEIWDKSERKVLFIAKGLKERPLQVIDPGVKFDGFFPCPRPLTTTTATDSIIPVPDFCEYQDQADEIDLMTQKIAQLTRALKVAGVYDGNCKADLTTLLQDSDNNTLIPVENWSKWAEQGGVGGSMSFLPLNQVVEALAACYTARDQAKQALYEITGIGDIIRGASDPRETLGAQQIKSQWGGVRIRDRQKEIQRFARDGMRLMGEVIAEHFSLETLKEMTGVKLLTAQEKQMVQMVQQAEAQQQAAMQAQVAPPQPGQPPQQHPAPPPSRIPPQTLELMQEPSWDEVIALLRNDKLRGFQIDIETDSTIQPDEAAEKQSSVELMGAITQFFTGVGPIMERAPQTAPMFGELLMSTLRTFRAAATLETIIEETMANVAKSLAQPKPPNPDAEAKNITAQAKLMDAKTDQFRAANEAKEAGVDAQIAGAKIQTEQGWQQLEGQQQQIDVVKAVNQPRPQPRPFQIQGGLQ